MTILSSIGKSIAEEGLGTFSKRVLRRGMTYGSVDVPFIQKPMRNFGRGLAGKDARAAALNRASLSRSQRAGMFVRKHPLALTSPIWVPGLALGAAGAAIHSTLNNSDPRDTPLVDAILEGVTGDAQMDRKIIGADIGFGQLYGLPGANNPISRFSRNMQLVNPSVSKFMAAQESMIRRTQDLGAQNVDQGYSTYPYPNTTMPYRPRMTRNLNASGDIVLGLFNGR